MTISRISAILNDLPPHWDPQGDDQSHLTVEDWLMWESGEANEHQDAIFQAHLSRCWECCMIAVSEEETTDDKLVPLVVQGLQYIRRKRDHELNGNSQEDATESDLQLSWPRIRLWRASELQEEPGRRPLRPRELRRGARLVAETLRLAAQERTEPGWPLEEPLVDESGGIQGQVQFSVLAFDLAVKLLSLQGEAGDKRLVVALPGGGQKVELVPGQKRRLIPLEDLRVTPQSSEVHIRKALDSAGLQWWLE